MDDRQVNMLLKYKTINLLHDKGSSLPSFYHFFKGYVIFSTFQTPLEHNLIISFSYFVPGETGRFNGFSMNYNNSISYSISALGNAEQYP